MKTNRKSQVLTALLCGCMILLQGCKKETPLKTSKSIIALDFGLVANELVKIDEANGTVWVNILWQNAWNLQAFITHTGVKIEPTDSQFRDYTRPVKYTITAEDGSTKVYTVIVTSARGNVKRHFAPSYFANQDPDFYKYLQGKVTNEPSAGVGSDFLVLSIGTEVVAGRKNNFGFDIYFPSTGLINSQPDFNGVKNVYRNIGGARANIYTNDLKGLLYFENRTQYGICESGTVQILSYDANFKIVTGNAKELITRDINSGDYLNGNCDFLNVPLR